MPPAKTDKPATSKLDDLKASFEAFVDRVDKLLKSGESDTTVSINLSATSGPGRTVQVAEKLTIGKS